MNGFLFICLSPFTGYTGNSLVLSCSTCWAWDCIISRIYCRYIGKTPYTKEVKINILKSFCMFCHYQLQTKGKVAIRIRNNRELRTVIHARDQYRKLLFTFGMCWYIKPEVRHTCKGSSYNFVSGLFTLSYLISQPCTFILKETFSGTVPHDTHRRGHPWQLEHLTLDICPNCSNWLHFATLNFLHYIKLKV